MQWAWDLELYEFKCSSGWLLVAKQRWKYMTLEGFEVGYNLILHSNGYSTMKRKFTTHSSSEGTVQCTRQCDQVCYTIWNWLWNHTPSCCYLIWFDLFHVVLFLSDGSIASTGTCSTRHIPNNMIPFWVKRNACAHFLSNNYNINLLLHLARTKAASNVDPIQKQIVY